MAIFAEPELTFILYRGNKLLHDKNGCGAGEMK